MGEPQQGHVAARPQQKRWHPSALPNPSILGPEKRAPPVVTPVITADLPIDYRLLLLSLADDYIAQARLLTADIVDRERDAAPEQYYRLMATGMRCLERCISTHSPGEDHRAEALLRLRYAVLLYEETDNKEELETLLGLSISFCERNRLLDLKYSLQHLQSRTMFAAKPKAALKYLDAVIDEAVTWQHFPWIYALRFLRLSLSMQLGHGYVHESSLQIKMLEVEAKRSRDYSVLAMAAIMSAYLQLKTRHVDAVSEAQRAIATANAALASTKGASDQMHLMVSMLSHACNLDPHDSTKSKMTRDALEELLATSQKDDLPADCATLLIPLDHTNGGNLTLETGGLFTRNAAGQDCLNFIWLSKNDAYVLGFLLSIASIFPAPGASLRYLDEVFKIIAATERAQARPTDLLTGAVCKSVYRKEIRSYLLLYLVLVYVDRSEWGRAHQALNDHSAFMAHLGERASKDIIQLMQYVRGVVYQATGALDNALAAYSAFSIPPPNTNATTHIQSTISILAGLNTLLMIHCPTHPDHVRAASIFADLQPHFQGQSKSMAVPQSVASANAHLCSAYRFTETLYNDLQLERKASLLGALKHAKRVNNLQLITFGTAYLCDFMCRGILGDTSLDQAKGGLKSSRLIDSKTWKCVTSAQLGDALELAGHQELAGRMREDAHSLLKWLPETLGVVADDDAVAGAGC